MKTKVLAVIVCFVMMFTGCANDVTKVDLGSFNQIENSYTYNKIPWHSSIKETEKLLSFKLGKPFSENVTTDMGVQDTYMPKQKIKLLYGKGYSELTFVNDKFSVISFNLTSTDNNKSLDELYTDIAKTLTDTYGKETEKTNKNHSINGTEMKFETSKWKIDKNGKINSLQVKKSKSNNKTDSVSILLGVFKKS